MPTTIDPVTRKPVIKVSALILVMACLITAGAAAVRLGVRGVPTQLKVVTPTPASLVGRGLAPPPSQRPDRQQAFTISWTRTMTGPDGQPRLLQTSKRYQRADGAYKLVHTIRGQNGSADRVETVFGYIGLGAFRLDEERRQLVFIAPMTEDQPEAVEAYLRADPRFKREDVVQGQRAIVWRSAKQRDAGFVEEFRAPTLGGLLIKRVEESGRRRQVLEPTEIEMGEPAAGLFAELEQYPADYARYDQSIARQERDGQHDAARLMRELTHRMKSLKPDKR
ncbi:MAG TPA: hypothetical protein VEY11_06855 [Pyrinomonadaceae bacterium]|nr:hypothetical protein [Pyrinomonadaceae bacterium]